MTLGQDIDLNVDENDAYNASIYYETMQEMEIPTNDPPTEQHPPTGDPLTEQVLSQGTQELISRAFK